MVVEPSVKSATLAWVCVFFGINRWHFLILGGSEKCDEFKVFISVLLVFCNLMGCVRESVKIHTNTHLYQTYSQKKKVKRDATLLVC